MKYNSTKNKAYNDWKRKDRTPQWAKINKRKRVYEAEYYTILTNLQGTLNFLDSKYDKPNLEGLGNYLYEIKDVIESQYIEKEDYNPYISQINLYQARMGYSLFYRSFYDKTGYDVHWKIEEVNYSRLAEKMYNITEKNKLKHLGGVRWLVWIKIK